MGSARSPTLPPTCQFLERTTDDRYPSKRVRLAILGPAARLAASGGCPAAVSGLRQCPRPAEVIGIAPGMVEAPWGGSLIMYRASPNVAWAPVRELGPQLPE
jgi:hypothetical protein